MRMRPKSGTTAAKNAQSYVLIGAVAGSGETPRSYGPRQQAEGLDIAYPPNTQLDFLVPPEAVSQRYVLSVEISVRVLGAATTTTEAIETDVSIV